MELVRDSDWVREIVEKGVREKRRELAQKRYIFGAAISLIISALLFLGVYQTFYSPPIRSKGAEDVCSFVVTPSSVFKNKFNLKIGCSFAKHVAVVVGGSEAIIDTFKTDVSSVSKLVGPRFETDELTVKVMYIENDNWHEITALRED